MKKRIRKKEPLYFIGQFKVARVGYEWENDNKELIAQYSGLSKEVIEVAFEEGSYPRYCDRNCDQNCDCFYENNCHGEHQNRCINDIADWLADELANLRELESKNGEASPVRRQLAMSRAQISDLAVMLLNRALPRLFTLRMLFESLLDVDRHRQAYDRSFNRHHCWLAQIG